MAYAEVSEVKAFLDITSNSDDTIIDALIDSAKKTIDAYCGRTFESWGDINEHGHRHTIYYYTPLLTRYGGNIENDGLTMMFGDDCVECHEVTNGDGTIIPSTEYVLLPANNPVKYAIRLRPTSLHRWTYTNDPLNAVSIEGVFAYSVHTPEDIHLASMLLVKHLYTSRTVSSDADRTVIAGGVVLAPSKIPDNVKTMINPYRRLN